MIDRREFHRLAQAALGGLLAGSALSCEQSPPPAANPAAPDGSGAGSGATGSGAAGTGAVAAAELHLCRGLNACQGQGGNGDNACAGQGSCATYEHHECGTQNACRGQGGCGAAVGSNDCRGQGGCAVPLMDHAWEQARAAFEERMSSQDKEFGAAPAVAD